MPTIESRLSTVERQLRFHRLVIAGLLVALVALVSYGATEAVPDLVVARALEIVDSKGIVRVRIKTDDKGSAILHAFGTEKAGSFALAFDAKGPEITLAEEGIDDSVMRLGPRVIESTTQRHLVRSILSSGTTMVKFGLRSASDGGVLIIGGPDFEPRAALSAAPNGFAFVGLNKTKEEVVQIYADEFGMGYVGAFDRQGKGRTLQPR